MGLLKNLFLTFIAGLFVGHMDGQVMWDQPIDLAAAHFDNNHPRITTNRAGDPLAIWGKVNDVQFTRWNGTAFTQPIKLNPGTVTVANADWMGPDMATHGDTVYVVYKQTPENLTTSHIWCMRSFDGGVTFDAPVRVDFTGDSLTRFPAITTDAIGNPIIAFMKFNPTFGEARWVVTRSDDFGSTFSADVKASGWSGPSSYVCDCCPGTIVCSGDVVSVIYRDNNINIRDNWAAVSTDGGRSFSGGLNVDQQNWFLQNCPASGPDGVIVGDTLYTISMNGGNIDELVYYNKASLTAMTCPKANPVTEYSNGLLQNYPRIANNGTAVAMLWRHNLNVSSQLGLYFTSDITKGFPGSYDTVAYTNVINADVALSKDKVYVVWQDNNSGTVKYKSGTYETRVGIVDQSQIQGFDVYPNPSDDVWNISASNLFGKIKIELIDIHGRTVFSNQVNENGNPFHFTLDNTQLITGLYVVKISDGKRTMVRKVVKE
jgi:hypothetical protein